MEPKTIFLVGLLKSLGGSATTAHLKANSEIFKHSLQNPIQIGKQNIPGDPVD